MDGVSFRKGVFDVGEDTGMTAKTCPRCGAGLFSDMDVCYGCLYDFKGGGQRSGAQYDTSEDVFFEEPGGEAEMEEPGLDEVWGSLDELWEDEDVWSDATQVAGGPPRASASGTARGGGPSDTLVLHPIADEAGAPWIRVCGPGLEVSCVVSAAGMTLGREEGNDLVVSAQAVSRRHLAIERCRGGAFVRDLGATNPALLNGRPLAGTCRLVVGDVLELRGSGVTVRLVPSPEARACAGGATASRGSASLS